MKHLQVKRIEHFWQCRVPGPPQPHLPSSPRSKFSPDFDIILEFCLICHGREWKDSLRPLGSEPSCLAPLCKIRPVRVHLPSTHFISVRNVMRCHHVFMLLGFSFMCIFRVHRWKSFFWVSTWESHPGTEAPCPTAGGTLTLSKAVAPVWAAHPCWPW